MPRRYRPEPWIIGNVEPSRDVERRPIEGGDRLCLADRCRIKGHEYLPLDAILSPPDAFPSLETTQPEIGRISGRFPVLVRLVRSRSASCRAIRRIGPGPRLSRRGACQPFAGPRPRKSSTVRRNSRSIIGLAI